MMRLPRLDIYLAFKNELIKQVKLEQKQEIKHIPL